MWTIIRQYWRVTIFKESPANTPYSLLLLILAYCFYVVMIVLQWQKTGVETQSDSLIGLTAALLVFSYLAYTALLLWVVKKGRRIIQTTTTMIVSHLIILIINYLLLLISPTLTEADMINPLMRLLLMLYIVKTLILVAWQFLVAAFIYKQALETDYFTAMLASVGLLAANILTIILWK